MQSDGIQSRVVFGLTLEGSGSITLGSTSHWSRYSPKTFTLRMEKNESVLYQSIKCRGKEDTGNLMTVCFEINKHHCHIFDPGLKIKKKNLLR